jgi:hypothetical protein
LLVQFAYFIYGRNLRKHQLIGKNTLSSLLRKTNTNLQIERSHSDTLYITKTPNTSVFAIIVGSKLTIVYSYLSLPQTAFCTIMVKAILPITFASRRMHDWSNLSLDYAVFNANTVKCDCRHCTHIKTFINGINSLKEKAWYYTRVIPLLLT